MKKKPTYKVPVSICAIVLFVGAIVLAILMETRQMAPPRKYEVDMSGEVIGIDNGPKIPVLTKEEDSPKPEATETEESQESEEPVIVPTNPDGQSDPAIKAPVPDIKKPTIDQIDN